MKNASNREVTLLRKLNRKKYRWEERLFLLEGIRAVRQVIDNGMVEIRTLYFDRSQEYWLQDPWKQVVRDCDSRLLDTGLFGELADTETPQGVLALCRIPDEASTAQLTGGEGMVIAADAIQDPGNLGTMIRTAGWFGAEGLLSGKGTVDLFHPKVVRGTAGATGSIPYRNCDLATVLEQFEEEGWRILLLDAGEGSADLRSIPAGGKTVVVTGNEARGIDRSLFGKNRQAVQIPPGGRSKNVESLNAAIALSIALYALSGSE